MDIQSFFKVTYGLYIVASHSGDKLNGHISNTVFQVSADPARFAIATHKDNLTTAYIQKSKVFSISVLQQDCNLEFLGPWGFQTGKEVNKFEQATYKTGKLGAPIVLEKSVAYIDCEVQQEIDTGSHIMFIGLAIDAEVLDPSQPPLTYGYYRDVIKGMSPENAPTYTDKSKLAALEEVKTESELKKFQCLVCGYIYDPGQGDPTKGIPPGTAFEDLPDNWKCPICGVGKEDFNSID
ncbi:MAG: High molecular weight rubredoxin [Bacteroidetes bacterium]|nr:MAG: High molecular weight rubredoxin [Bacteroidota bacterium]